MKFFRKQRVSLAVRGECESFCRRDSLITAQQVRDIARTIGDNDKRYVRHGVRAGAGKRTQPPTPMCRHSDDAKAVYLFVKDLRQLDEHNPVLHYKPQHYECSRDDQYVRQLVRRATCV